MRSGVVKGIQAFHQDKEEARAGENVGLLLRGVKRDEIYRGEVLSIPGAVRPHREGYAELYVLTAKEGGRHTPFATGYTPQFFFGATDVTGTLDVLGDAVAPGEVRQVKFTLMRPVGIEPGMRFALREGQKTVGAGRVTSVT